MASSNPREAPYQVLNDWDLAALEKQVNQAIVNGWQPLGGIAVIGNVMEDGEISTYYYQAMTKPAAEAI
jgi:hypothetical protein